MRRTSWTVALLCSAFAAACSAQDPEPIFPPLVVDVGTPVVDPDSVMLRSLALELGGVQRELISVGTQCPCRMPLVIDVPPSETRALRFSLRGGAPLLTEDAPLLGAFSVPFGARPPEKVVIVTAVRSGRLEIFAYDWNPVVFLPIERTTDSGNPD